MIDLTVSTLISIDLALIAAILFLFSRCGKPHPFDCPCDSCHGRIT